MNMLPNPRFGRKFFRLFLLLGLWLSGCTLPQNQTPDPALDSQPGATTAAPRPFSQFGVSFVLDSFLAADVAVSLDQGRFGRAPESFAYDLMPDHLVFTLQESYAEGQTLYRQAAILPASPQIMIFPIEAYRTVNPLVFDPINRLEALLADRSDRPTGELPLLPPPNGFQMLRSQAAYLEFQNGSGLRYLTQIAQETRTINNEEIFYTFQGVTANGLFYIAAFFPVSTAILPAEFTAAGLDLLTQQMDRYLQETTATLDGLSAADFQPDLTRLDELIRTLVAAPTIDLARIPEGPVEIVQNPAPESLEMTSTTSSSPDGRKQAIVSRSNPVLVDSREMVYTTLTVRDGEVTWTPIAEWRMEKIDALFPTVVGWSDSSLDLFYTNSGSPFGCARFVSGTDFYRLDVTTGLVTEILGGNSTVAVALSPDQATLAYLGWSEMGTVIAFRQLATLEEERVIITEPAFYTHAGSLTWSADGAHLLATLADDACGPRWSQSIVRIDPGSGNQAVLIDRDRRLFSVREWAGSDRARLTDLNGKTWWLDVTSGEVIREG